MNTVQPANHSKGVEYLVQQLADANKAYRLGDPVLTDYEYDEGISWLKDLAPEHPWLHQVEPEPFGVLGYGLVTHKEPMLSTDKVYTEAELSAFVKRVENAAETLGIPLDTLRYKITAKLDGLSGYRHPVDNVEMATRGDGLFGEDISTAFNRLTVIGQDVKGPGEIVMPSAYFLEKLKPMGFKSTRNVMVGLIGADTLKEHHIMAINDGMAQFVPYQNLPAEIVDGKTLMASIVSMSKTIRASCIYDTDGVVVDVVDEDIRQFMGDTSKHHRWQIAYKTHGDTAETTVNSIDWQTGRTGRVTPVVNLQPVELSNATISRATMHTPNRLVRKGVGVGAIVKIIRAGEVIPKIIDVIKSVKSALPEGCPSCGGALEAEGQYLVCSNVECAAQREGKIIHFFKTLGTADGFGPKTVETIVAAGIHDLVDVLRTSKDEFVKMGFGAGESQNLVDEIHRCLNTTVEDWRLLAALGIRHLGRSDSRTLLEAIGGMDALPALTVDGIASIKGFSSKTAPRIHYSITQSMPKLNTLRSMGFPLEMSSQVKKGTALQDMSLVFTGTFSMGRQDMQKAARAAGANVQASVNKNTTVLVIGEKVGAKKTEAAQDLGVTLWTEAEFWAKVNA